MSCVYGPASYEADEPVLCPWASKVDELRRLFDELLHKGKGLAAGAPFDRAGEDDALQEAAFACMCLVSNTQGLGLRSEWCGRKITALDSLRRVHVLRPELRKDVRLIMSLVHATEDDFPPWQAALITVAFMAAAALLAAWVKGCVQ